MHDTDATAPLLQPGTLREDAVTSLPHPAGREAPKASSAQNEIKAPGLVQRLMAFIVRLFKARRRKQIEFVPDASVSERAATAQAAQLPPPMAFKGDTANTLATPIGAYAGKPVEHAMRKRAEQQFKNLDITQTTIH